MVIVEHSHYAIVHWLYVWIIHLFVYLINNKQKVEHNKHTLCTYKQTRNHMYFLGGGGDMCEEKKGKKPMKIMHGKNSHRYNAISEF